MARIITDLDDAIEYLNTLFEGDSTAPTSGEEDYEVWTSLLNTAINIWENEEGILWKELHTKLASAADGTKTTSAGVYSYACPSDFNQPASGFVWLGSGNQKKAYSVIPQEQVQLLENNSDDWCYFNLDGSPTLEFNPNLTISGGDTISYNYYKYANKLSTGTSTFEMADPFFAIYYALSELKKDEGDTSALTIATQKLDAMKIKNIQPAWYQENSLEPGMGSGFGI